jgi:uncharacterized protein YfdQ (DUF2303 family)
MERDEVNLAVEKIAQLGQDSTKFDVLSYAPPPSLGLPSNVPFGFNHQSGAVVDLRDLAERWRAFPERRKGVAKVSTLQSFIDLLNRQKSEHSVIFATTSWPSPSLTAVVDYNGIVNAAEGKPAENEARAGITSPKPGYGQHRIQYPFPLTDEFQAWAKQDGKPMTQAEFAAFIEERVAELATPTQEEDTQLGQLFSTKMATPADMLMLSRGLEINVAGKVKENVRLSSGEGEIIFVEEHLGSNGQKIVVPGLFMVSVPAFLDGEAVRLPARLRYRVSAGSVTWFYQLYRWKELLRERVVADLKKATDNTKLPAYEGSPEA